MQNNIHIKDVEKRNSITIFDIRGKSHDIPIEPFNHQKRYPNADIIIIGRTI